MKLTTEKVQHYLEYKSLTSANPIDIKVSVILPTNLYTELRQDIMKSFSPILAATEGAQKISISTLRFMGNEFVFKNGGKFDDEFTRERTVDFLNFIQDEIQPTT